MSGFGKFMLGIFALLVVGELGAAWLRRKPETKHKYDPDECEPPCRGKWAQAKFACDAGRCERDVFLCDEVTVRP